LEAKKSKKSIKKTLWLPNFKGRACNLDFLAIDESNFAAYFTGCQIKGRNVDKKSILEAKVDLSRRKKRSGCLILRGPPVN